MAPSSRDNTKRKRPEQTGTLIGVRLQPEQLSALDAWIGANAPEATRPEGIRKILGTMFGEGQRP